jgi:2-amino-4-hydroxy-6-hydroxymethyldihydropteridine diphosphokinase
MAQPAFSPKKYINVYLSLGSNEGNRLANLRTAAELIHKNVGKIARKSHVYETEPWGKKDQDTFYNQVIMINTTMEATDLLAALNKVEREMGRTRKETWGPRIIDIDILFYGKRILRTKDLNIPHAEIANRAFVLIPMMEIAPDFEHPALKKRMDELYMVCTDASEVVMLNV